MDAKISVDRSINRLQDFVAHRAEAENNPKLKEQVLKAIDIFQRAKPFLKDVDHDFDKALLPGGSVIDLTNTAPLLRAVYSAEDAAETFVFSKDSEQRQEERDTTNTIRKYFRSCFCCCGSRQILYRNTAATKHLYSRFLCSQELESSCCSNVFNRKMKKLDDEIKRMTEARTNSGIENNNNTRLLSFQNDRDSLSRRQPWERISDFRFEEETQVVGFQNHINDLVLRLIPQQHRDGDLSTQVIADLSTQVIAVVGERGSGKRTLSRIVYNRLDVKRHFVIRAWVRISSVYNARDVLVDILEQVNPVESVDRTLNEVTLMQQLIALLNETRFLIVLEDVDLLQDWKSLVSTVSSSCKDGKIIITACNAEDSPPIAAYSLRPLNHDESWKLFSIKVRIAEDELHNSELIRLKEQILSTCGGLPSIIVLLGGLLSTKEKTYDEWSSVLIKLADETNGDVLALSYQDLPSEVKPCFLYIGLFPKGFEIPIRRLIHLWCAEGFMTPPNSGRNQEIDPEDLAKMCLKELITRHMVEVRWRIDGSPKTCCMPSFLYDLFSSKAANVGFLRHHFQSSHTISKQQHATIRRLAAYMGIDYFPSSSDHCVENIRSYVAFDSRVRVTLAVAFDLLLSRIISKRGFGLLRLLDLEGAYRPFISSYPTRSLFLLRYLSLRSTFIHDLPEWVGYMPYLETLDVKHTCITFIGLQKTNKLRHIYLSSNYNPDKSSFLPDSNNQLRTLSGIRIRPSSASGPFNLTNRTELSLMTSLTKLRLMTSLTKLRLCVQLYDHEFQPIAEWIDRLTTLQSLKLELSGYSVHDFVEVPIVSLRSMAEHHRLQEVYLLAGLSPPKIDVGFFPPNLTKLTLSVSQLEEDPMPVLGQLPYLHILRLSSCFSNEVGRMTCLSKGFLKLRQLKLWDLLVQVWTVEEGAMPCLRELEFRSCDHLNLPQGLQNVTTLKELVLTNMPKSFQAAVEDNFRGGDVCIRDITCVCEPYI